MPLPEDFNAWEHLQSTVIQVQNRIVREEFSDLGDDWDNDILTSRGSLRVACTMVDDDSAIQTLIRLWLFYGCLKKAADFQAPIYGIPVLTFQEQMKFLPQVRLYFSEDLNEVEHGFNPLEAEVTFRLVNETSASMTEAKAKVIANKIKTAFCSSGGFRWKKGREKWIYKDQSRGYDIRLLAWSESEAKRLIEQVLDIESHSPNWEKYLDGTKKEKTFVTVPPLHTVYGKQRREYRERPVGYVRFRYAELKLHGLPNDIQLVDRTGNRKNPLVKAN